MKYRPVAAAPAGGGSEGDVVVKGLIFFRAAAYRLAESRVGPLRATAACGARLATHATATTAQHLHVVADDLGGVTVVALLILPLARAQTALDVDLRALAQVLARDFGQAAEEGDAVPLGLLLHLTGLLVLPALAGSDAQIAFKDLMIHRILQFTLLIAFRCVLHRCESQDIHC